MLTRKPRIGEVLEYVGLAGEPVDVVVVGYWDRNPSIMTIRFPDGYPCHSRDQEIIWEFHDGLNKALSHKPENPKETS